jgi:hypothetical protein
MAFSDTQTLDDQSGDDLTFVLTKRDALSSSRIDNATTLCCCSDSWLSCLALWRSCRASWRPEPVQGPAANRHDAIRGQVELGAES